MYNKLVSDKPPCILYTGVRYTPTAHPSKPVLASRPRPLYYERLDTTNIRTRKAFKASDRAPNISKSKNLAGLQCPKLLWTHFNDRDLIPEPDEAQQHIFDTGHMVGDLAKRLYPGGKEVPMIYQADDALELTVTATQDLMKRRIPIFEASFLVDDRYCRVDVLVPVPGPDGDRASGDAVTAGSSAA